MIRQKTYLTFHLWVTICVTNQLSSHLENNLSIMELINKDTPQVKEFISSLDSMLNGIESIVKHYKPHLNGERFLSNNEVSKKLNVSLRTLQEWRDIGLIPFIQIKGKIIYRQSDIDKLLQKHYFESWKE